MDGLPAVQLIANRFTMQDQRIKDQEEEAFRVLSAEIEANIAHEEATIGFSSSFSLSFFHFVYWQPICRKSLDMFASLGDTRSSVNP